MEGNSKRSLPLDKELLVIIDVSKLLGTVTDGDNKG